jgi:hypothetical protein
LRKSIIFVIKSITHFPAGRGQTRLSQTDLAGGRKKATRKEWLWIVWWAFGEPNKHQRIMLTSYGVRRPFPVAGLDCLNGSASQPLQQPCTANFFELEVCP